MKLGPTSIDAWVELGECYWKKGDVDNSYRCFQGALNYVSRNVECNLCSIQAFESVYKMAVLFTVFPAHAFGTQIVYVSNFFLTV